MALTGQKMTQTLLHFGYAKTATTYLQRRVFPSAKGINYLGKPFDLQKGKIADLFEKYLNLKVQKIHRFEPFFEYEDIMRVKNYDDMDLTGLQNHIFNSLSSKKLNLWSHEGYLRPGRKNSPFDRKSAIRNLERVFKAAGSEEVKALIVLRDTKKILKSHAVQFHRDFDYLRIGDLSLKEVIEFRNSNRQDRYAALIWRLWYEYLDYQPLIDDLIEVLGADHVYVLKYEDMVTDWSLLEDLLRSINPLVKCNFSHFLENSTEDKPYELSLPLQAYLDSIETCDPNQIFPDNYDGIEKYCYTKRDA
jgi:hypothetical protein